MKKITIILLVIVCVGNSFLFAKESEESKDNKQIESHPEEAKDKSEKYTFPKMTTNEHDLQEETVTYHVIRLEEK